ncbi:MAG: FAD-dependent oxidoreductase, partial [Cyanobacteria bacterium]|nr:FAD-dependent oxidoreductase [Cyanobacteriota bacterium]
GFSSGIYFPFEGQVDNRQLMEALGQTLHAQNVIWESNTLIEQATPYQVKTARKNHTFDWVIDCRGLGAAQDISSQHPSTVLRGVRGEIIRIHCPSVHLNRPVRLMHPRYPLYIVPRENHHFIIGATSLETEDFRNVTVQSALELLSACFSLNPGFSEATLEEFSTNCRPAFENNCPQIFHQPGLIQVNGLYRHGFLMAPALILEVEKLLSSPQKELAKYPNLIQAPLIKEGTHQRSEPKEEFVYGTC